MGDYQLWHDHLHQKKKCLGSTRALADGFFSGGVQQEAGLGWTDGGEGRRDPLPPWLSLPCSFAGTVHQMMLPPCFQVGTIALGILIFLLLLQHVLTLPGNPDTLGGACASPGWPCSALLQGHPVCIDFPVQNQAGYSLCWISRNKSLTSFG